VYTVYFILKVTLYHFYNIFNFHRFNIKVENNFKYKQFCNLK